MDRQQLNEVLMWIGRHPKCTVEDVMEETGIGEHPEMLKMLAGIGDFINSKIGEDTLEGVKSSGALAPDDVRAKLSEIRAPNSPYWDQRHPEHSFYVNEGLRLQEMLSVSG